MRRQLFGVVIAALVVAITTPVVATSANATAYRYWSYWHDTNGSWSFSQIGATGAHPADGTVEGWRFAVSPGTASAPAPRQSASTAFSSICGKTPAAGNGKKRVALVVDFGVRADAPSGDSPPSSALHGSCIVIRSAANGWDVLVAANYAIRSEDGLVCGLAGYPTRGCGEVVADAAPAPTATHGSTPGATKANGSGSGSGSKSGSGSATTNGTTTKHSTGSDDPASTARATTTMSATASPSATSTARATSPDDAIPSAQPLDTSSALPSLVEGAPAADTSGTSSNPWHVVLAILVIAALGGAAFVRVRARRSP